MDEWKNYPTITGILSATKPEKDRKRLEAWRQRIGEEKAEEVSEQAKARGNRYDEMVQLHLEGKEIEHKPFQDFLSQNKILSTEQRVWSDEYQFRGRYDAIMDLGREGESHIVLVDFKGASRWKKREWITDYFLQLAAYRICCQEQGIHIDKAMICLILPDELQFEFVALTSFYEHAEKFLYRLDEYYEQQHHEQ